MTPTESSDSKMLYVRYMVLVGTLALAPGSWLSCESNSNTPDEPPETAEERPTSFRSEGAPYRFELPEGWELTSPKEINSHADVAATSGGDFFLIVIPQELPSVSGVDSPGVDALKSASLERMTANVKNLSVEREGPVQLDGEPGLSVFAEGMVDRDPVQYVATFATHEGWGYQIVAWGPRDRESELVTTVDAVVQGWQFTDSSVQFEESGGQSDAESAPHSKDVGQRTD